MKRCPKCDEIFSIQFDFCINDGSTLIETDIGLNEYETVIRGNPFVVDLGSHDGPDQKRLTTPSHTPQQNETATDRKPSYGLLLSGVGIGGLLVLATMVAMNSFEPNAAAVQPILDNKAQAANANSEIPKPENTNSAGANSNVTTANVKNPEKNKTDETKGTEISPETPIPANKIPSQPSRKSYNGRVIMLNAIVRSAPSIDAPEINMVTFNEPLKIGRSAGGNNPWYRVTTASGQSGWMHGNTIEFVR